MAIRCRTCGEQIYNLDAKNLFEHQTDRILNKIESLTGLLLSDQLDLPKHICAFCLMDLNQAISFRERCIKTHQLLLSGNYKSPKRENVDHLDPLNNADDDFSDNVNTIDLIVDPDGIEATELLQYKQDFKNKTRLIDSAPKLKVTASIPRPHARALQATKTPKFSISKLPKAALLPSSAPHTPAKQVKIRSFAKSTSPKADDAKNLKSKITRKDYICDQCGWCFNDSSNLKLHLLRHTGVKQFECNECGHKYFTQHLLNLHIRVRHQGEKPYACKHCGQRFSTSTSRTHHEQKRHSTERSFVCLQCDKSFFTRTCLKKHEFKHSNERPHRCEPCDVAFQRRTNLKIHFRSKQHQQRVDAVGQDVAQVVTDDEIQFDFNDSIIEEIDD